MLALIASISFLIFSQTNAQTAGACYSTPVIPNFESSRYLGKWFEIERFPFVFENDLQCVTAEYSVLNETSIQVKNYGFNTVKNKGETVIGYAYVKNSAEANKLTVVLPVVVAGITVLENTANYNVVATDYDNWALVYSCSQIIPSLLKFETSWILSRTKTLDSQTVQTIKNIAKSYNIDVNKYELIDQNC